MPGAARSNAQEACHLCLALHACTSLKEGQLLLPLPLPLPPPHMLLLLLLLLLLCVCVFCALRAGSSLVRYDQPAGAHLDLRAGSGYMERPGLSQLCAGVRSAAATRPSQRVLLHIWSEHPARLVQVCG